MERTIKYAILFLCLCSSNSLFSQDWQLNSFLFQRQRIDSTELLNAYKKHDFSKVWKASKPQTTFGIIGDSHQRFYMQFLTAVKDSIHPEVYNITGKTRVKNNICNFEGHIYIQSIKKLSSPEYGVDNEYKSRIKDQGLMHFEFELFEDNNQKHSGIFKGYGVSKWYLDTNNQIQYDAIQIHSDGYCNNAFIGEWQKYGGTKSKICVWGDYRVPITNKDFDIGTGAFVPNKKYSENGWKNYLDALSGNKNAQLKEDKQW